jgi:hypothetical protein
VPPQHAAAFQMPHRDVDVLAGEQRAGDARRANLRAAMSPEELQDRPLRRSRSRRRTIRGPRGLQTIRALDLATRCARSSAHRDRDRRRDRGEDRRDLIDGNATAAYSSEPPWMGRMREHTASVSHRRARDRSRAAPTWACNRAESMRSRVARSYGLGVVTAAREHTGFRIDSLRKSLQPWAGVPSAVTAIARAVDICGNLALPLG